MLTATLFTELPGGYVVCTLESLIKEFKNKSQLTQKFPEGYAEDYIEELEKVKFVPTEEEEEAIEENIRVWLGYTQDHVEMERKAAGLTLSRLSKPDVDILFTAWTMDFHLATDEDPMTRAFHYLNEEKRIQIFSTLTLMKLLEDIDVVNEDKRKRCIKKIGHMQKAVGNLFFVNFRKSRMCNKWLKIGALGNLAYRGIGWKCPAER